MSAPSVPLDKIEWRVDGKPTQGQNPRCRFVPYIDARTAAALLDEWVGPENWSDEYQPVSGVDGKPAMWCVLSVRFGDDWVSKRDVGVASNFEAMKGLVSDAFKRAACVKWGVGRNVYDLPTIWAPCRVDQQGRAWPNEQSLPSILKELKAEGYEASGGTVAGSPDVQAGSDQKAPEPERSERASTSAKAPPPASSSEGAASPLSSAAAAPSGASSEVGGGAGEVTTPTSDDLLAELLERFGPGKVLAASRKFAVQHADTVPVKADDLGDLGVDTLLDTKRDLESRMPV